MLSSRLTRTAFALVAILAAYWAYALLAVPWIEPRAVRRQESDSPDDASGPRQPARTDYQKLLAEILPPGSWELSEPKVIRSRSPRAMLLFKDYRTLPEGRIKLEPCTAIFFLSHPPGQEGPSRGRAIVLQAPEGAVLNSDSPLDLSRARFGKLVSGRLEGPVTVWSKESRPGAGDDLEIVTRDIQIHPGRIETPHKVRFRYGNNSGSGRHLLIRLSQSATNEAASTAPEAIQGVESLELLHLDKIVLAPNPQSPIPNPQSPVPNPQSPIPNSQSPTPVEVTCRGPLRFDLVRSMVTLKEEVDVHWLLADGPSDQLNCELLEIYIGRREEQDTALGAERLGTVQRIVAIGHPVTFRSPSQGRQIEVSGQIQYQLPVTGLLGLLEVDGPGQFRGPISEHDSRVVEASWGKQARLKADGADHVFSLTGGAKVGLAGMGGISSEQMHVWLEEVELRDSPGRRVHAAHAAPPGVDAGAKHPPPTNTTIRPQRLMALGNVRIDSPLLTGVIRDRLEAWFEDRPHSDERDARRLGSSGNDPRRPGQQFHIQSDRVRILVVLQDETPQVEEVMAAGHVDLKQIRGGRLQLNGQLVRLSQANSPNSTVLVQGKPARVQADGLTIRGDDIHLDRGKNRLWIEGPGRLTMMMTSDLQGRPLNEPRPIDVSWRERMDFDGQLVHFEKSVEIHGQQQRAWANTLDVTLNRRIDFARAEPPGDLGLRKLHMDGGVRLVNRTVEAGRLVSIDHLEVPSLDVDQLAGKLDAAGPGWMSTTRRGTIDLMRRASTTSAGARPDNQPEDSLTYLHVTFQQKITGDILRRQIKLHRNVVAVYGPVGDWEEKLPGGMDARPTRRGAVLNCGLLQVTQMPTFANPSGTFELEALDGARIDGQNEQGHFTALGQHISYSQAKDLLVLRGGGRSDAELLRQTTVGGPISRMAFRKLFYWPSADRLEIKDARSGSGSQ